MVFSFLIQNHNTGVCARECVNVCMLCGSLFAYIPLKSTTDETKRKVKILGKKMSEYGDS
jgi:hypothetical protein